MPSSRRRRSRTPTLSEFPAAGHGVLGNDACACHARRGFPGPPGIRRPRRHAWTARARSISRRPFRCTRGTCLPRESPPRRKNCFGQTLNYQETRLRPDDPGIARHAERAGHALSSRGTPSARPRTHSRGHSPSTARCLARTASRRARVPGYWRSSTTTRARRLKPLPYTDAHSGFWSENMAKNDPTSPSTATDIASWYPHQTAGAQP